MTKSAALSLHSQPGQTNAGTSARSRLPSGWMWFVPLLLLLLLQRWFPPVVDPQVNDSFNVDWGGRNVLFQFVQRRTEATRNFASLARALTDLPTDNLLVLLGPSRPPTGTEQQALRDWIYRGGRMLYAAPLGKPQTSFSFLTAEIEAFTEQPSNPLQNAFPNLVPQLPNEFPPVQADLTGELSLESVDWQTRARLVAKGPAPARRLVTNASGLSAAEWPLGRGRAVLVASDHVFSNASLAQRNKRNGVLAIQLLEFAGRPPDSVAPAGLPARVVFDESLNATGSPRVVGLLLTPLLRPLTLQAMLLWWLFSWQGSQRFGRALPPVLSFRHSITDHTDALGNLYWRSGNAVGPLLAYMGQTVKDLKLTCRQLTPQRLEALSRRSGVDREEIERLLKLPDEIAERSAVLPADAAHIVRRFARLRRVIEST